MNSISICRLACIAGTLLSSLLIANGAAITCTNLTVDSLHYEIFAPTGYGGLNTTISGGEQIVTPASGVLAWAVVRQDCFGTTGPTTYYMDAAMLVNKWHARLKYTPTGNEVPSGSYLVGYRLSDNTSEFALAHPSISPSTWYGFQSGGRLTRPSDNSTDLGIATYSGGRTYFDGPPYGTQSAANGGVVGTKWIFAKVRFALEGGEWIGHTYLQTTIFAQGNGLFSVEMVWNDHGILRDEQVEVYSVPETRDMLRGSFDPDGGNNANPGGEQVVVDFRTPNTTNVVYQAVLQVEPDGGDFKYEIPTPDTPGEYDLSIQYDRCLRKTITVDTDDLETEVDIELINGDINLDNSIDIADYAALSVFYEMDDSDEDWLTPDPESLLAPVDSDLNGDGAVDIGDYSIISTNLNEEGDE